MQASLSLHEAAHGFEQGGNAVSLFSHVNLEIDNHGTTAIVGPSGVGKSTLLLLLAGLETPLSGQLRWRLNGQAQPVRALRQHTGFIFQQFHLLPELSALHNLALPLKVKGHKDALATAAEWLARVGLTDRASHRPAQLSGGEQQRIAIARAFISRPAFVFADEPTGNLDTTTAAAITDLMFACAKEHHTGLVLVTHDLALAAKADRCFEVNHGRVMNRLIATAA